MTTTSGCGTLEMKVLPLVVPPICKFCKTQQPDFRQLKIHCEDEHFHEYRKVSEWIGKTVSPRLETFEKLAAEGMIGAQETGDK